MSDPNKSRDVKDILTEFQSNKESAPAHDGSCSSDPAPAHDGSCSSDPAPAHDGSCSSDPAPAHDGSCSSDPAPAHDGSCSSDPAPAHDGSCSSDPAPAHDGSCSSDPAPAHDGSCSSDPAPAHDGSCSSDPAPAHDGSCSSDPAPAHDGSCSSDPAPAPSSDEGAGANQARNVIFVGNKPIMTYVTATLTQLSSLDVVTIKARGQKITRAVDISQMISKRMDSVGYVVSKVRISSDSLTSQDGKERKVSTIEIDIAKT